MSLAVIIGSSLSQLLEIAMAHADIWWGDFRLPYWYELVHIPCTATQLLQLCILNHRSCSPPQRLLTVPVQRDTIFEQLPRISF